MAVIGQMRTLSYARTSTNTIAFGLRILRCWLGWVAFALLSGGELLAEFQQSPVRWLGVLFWAPPFGVAFCGTACAAYGIALFRYFERPRRTLLIQLGVNATSALLFVALVANLF